MKLSVIIVKLPDIIQKFFPGIDRKNFLNENKIFFSNNCKLSGFFHENEAAIINQFTTFKRQIEWIGGRLAIKKLVEQYTGDRYESKNIIIAHKENGAPCLNAFPCWGISISHSHDYAIGAICYKNNRRIGIDVEKIESPLSPCFIDLAFTQREIQELKTKPSDDLYKNWTIKESFLKLIEMGFNESLKRVEIVNNRLHYYNQWMNSISIINGTIDNAYIYSLLIHNKNEEYTLDVSNLELCMLEQKKYIAVA